MADVSRALQDGVTPEELAQSGIRPNTIRLSIGTEHIDDILADLARIVRIVCQRLRIREQHVLPVAFLQSDAISQRANKVTKMQWTRGAVARENDRQGIDFR